MPASSISRKIRPGTLLAFVALLGAVLALGCISHPTPSPVTTAPPPSLPPPGVEKEYVDMDFREFLGLFGRGGNRSTVWKHEEFNRNYRGKYINGTCFFQSLEEPLTMALYCGGHEPPLPNIYVALREDQKDEVLKLDNESLVTFEARLTEYSLWGIGADDGVIIAAWKQPSGETRWHSQS